MEGTPVTCETHWRPLVNTIGFVLPSVLHLCPQHKQRINRFSHFHTAHDGVSMDMPSHVLSPNNRPLHEGLVLHVIHASRGSPESITEMASQSVQPFQHRSRQSVVILYNGLLPNSPCKLLLPTDNLCPHLTHESLGPSKSTT